MPVAARIRSGRWAGGVKDQLVPFDQVPKNMLDTAKSKLPEVAFEQAQDRGHDVDSELCLYVIHGILHLCGYDDRTEKDTKEMRRMERKYLAELKLPAISE